MAYVSNEYSNPGAFITTEERDTLREFMVEYMKNGPKVISTSCVRKELDICWPDASIAVHNYVRYIISQFVVRGFLKQVTLPPSNLVRTYADRYTNRGVQAFRVQLTTKGIQYLNS